jgi:hypothetical protein
VLSKRSHSCCLSLVVGVSLAFHLPRHFMLSGLVSRKFHLAPLTRGSSIFLEQTCVSARNFSGCILVSTHLALGHTCQDKIRQLRFCGPEERSVNEKGHTHITSSSSLVKNVIAIPCLPARPVRPGGRSLIISAKRRQLQDVTNLCGAHRLRLYRPSGS